MSFDALSWAAKQRPGNLAAKMVLLALANFADEHGCAYPSTAAIAEFGDMNHKTATAALDRLQEAGLISDTGRRAGRSAQIKVYQLSIGSLPKTEASQKRKPPVFSGKAPQKRVTDTVRDTSSGDKSPSPCARRSKAKFVLPSWVPVDPWEGWLAMRKAKRSPASERAMELAVGKLDQFRQQGFDPGEVLDQSTLKGWTDVYPLKDGNQPRGSPLSPQSDLAALLKQGERYRTATAA